MALNCTGGHSDLAVSSNVSCVCYGPYYGTLCESTYDYWFPITAALVTVDAILMFVGLVALLVRFVRACRVGECSGPLARRRLANQTLILNTLGALFQLIYDIVPNEGVTGIYPDSLAMTIIGSILSTFAVGFWLAATMLVTGFWLDILGRNELREKMKKSTRVACIIGAWLVLICVPGLVLYFVPGKSNSIFHLLGSVLVLLPVLVDMVALVIVGAIIVHALREHSAKMGKTIRARTRRAVKWLWVIIGTWIVYVASIIFGVAAGLGKNNVSPLNSAVLGYSALHVACHALFTSSLLILCNRSKTSVGESDCCALFKAPGGTDSTSTGEGRTPTDAVLTSDRSDGTTTDVSSMGVTSGVSTEPSSETEVSPVSSDPEDSVAKNVSV